MRVRLAGAMGVLAYLTTGASELPGQAAARASSASSDSSSGRATSSSARDWEAWVSLGSIEGSASAPELPAGRRGSGGNLELWGTYKLGALCVRTASLPFISDGASGMGDHAALLGLHVPMRAHEDFVVAVGGGQSFGTGYLVPLHTEGMLEGAAQFNLNYRFMGLGIDAVMAAGKTRHYAAGGVSLSFGRFR